MLETFNCVQIELLVFNNNASNYLTVCKQHTVIHETIQLYTNK